MEGIDVVRRPPFGDNPLVGERGANTQRRILDAALGVFAQHGYHDTRVELITEAAGCSRPAFYQYFSSKEDVFWRLAAHMAKAMDGLVTNLGDISPDQSGVTYLRQWLGELVDLCTLYAPLLSSFQAASRDQARTARGSRAVNERFGVAFLRHFDPAGPRPPVAAASVTVTVVLRAIHYWRLGLGQIPRARFEDALAQTTHRLLHGAIPGVNLGPITKAPPKRAPKWPSPPEGHDERPLRPRGQQTRQRLLDAGSAILPICGYHDTRVDDIVEEARVSHGSFYRYFPSKDALFQVLAAEAATTMVQLLAEFPADAGDDLGPWFVRWFATYRDNGGILSAWQEIGQDDPDLAAFSFEVATAAFDRLVRIVHERGFGDATVDAIVLLSVIERVPYSVLVMAFVDETEAIEASDFFIQRCLFGLATT